MKRISLLPIVGLVLVLPGCGGEASSGNNPQVLISTSEGDIKAELFESKAPLSVKNFLKYVDDKHYDGTIFHRVIPDFMIQGGGFTPTLEEKPTRAAIRCESSNGLRNERGTLAMARTGAPDSATAQFYINTVNNPKLDRANADDGVGYAVFGKVIEGIYVVDQIRRVETYRKKGVHEDLPKVAVHIKSIRRVSMAKQETRTMSGPERRLIAYEVSDWQDMPLTTASLDRAWMDETSQRFAYRCLPLTIANQAGWVIACPSTFTATWDGGHQLDNLRIEAGAPQPPANPYVNVFTFGTEQFAARPDGRILSHFGHGILTFTVPYLFRTPPGINLWVKGPSNHIKDGVQALEGIVETDWLPSTFTMNWQMTRPGYPVTFRKGEPICMVVPVPRGLAETLEPVQIPIEAVPELQDEYRKWEVSRRQFNLDLKVPASDAVRRGWQREYVKGVTPSGQQAPEHQTRIDLKEFKRSPS